MVRRKKTGGMTLAELLLALALLAVVMAAAGTAIFSAAQSYTLTKKMQEDEYNLRLALLSIIREVHRGVKQVDAGTPGELTLTMDSDSAEITYRYDLADSTLKREASGDTPVPFAQAELAENKLDAFRATAEPPDDPRWLTLCVEGRYGMTIETKIAIFRVPPGVSSSGSGEEDDD